MRERLPNRHDAITETVNVDGLRLHITFGFREDNITCGEVFFKGGKPGSPVDIVCSDLGILLSLALQSGLTPEILLASMQKLDSGRPAGPLGVALEMITQGLKVSNVSSRSLPQLESDQEKTGTSGKEESQDS